MARITAMHSIVATLAHCQERARGGIPSAAECVDGSKASLKVAEAPWGVPHQHPSPPGKLQSRYAFEATEIGAALPRSGACFCGRHRRSDVPSSRIEGDTSFTLSALNDSTSRARVKVRGSVAHNTEHTAPEVAALENTDSNEPATWASPARKVGPGASQEEPKATLGKSGGSPASPREKIRVTRVGTSHHSDGVAHAECSIGTTPETTKRARRSTPTPAIHPDRSTASTKGIGKQRRGVFMLPHFTSVGPMGACSVSG